MPIRQRLYKKYRKLPYHKQFGMLSTPPLLKTGYTPLCGGWPLGSEYIHRNVGGRRGRSVVIGWVVRRDFGQFQSLGVFIASKVSWKLGRHRGHQIANRDGTVTLVGDPLGYHDGFNPRTDFKYVGECYTDYDDAWEMLKDAWVEHHGVTLP